MAYAWVAPLLLLGCFLMVLDSCFNIIHIGSSYFTYDSKHSFDGIRLPNTFPDAAAVAYENGDEYMLGVGKADITGPVVEINFMGYADTKQVGTGLRQRLYSRAFIIGSKLEPKDRVVYLVLDTQSGDTAIRHGILEGIKQLGPEYAVYGRSNIAVTGTHSHSGPGAWLNYLLPQITSKGFDKQSYEAIVSGTVLSVKRAHEGLQPGLLEHTTADVDDANINRSLYAYLANPEAERAKYTHSVDKSMDILKFIRAADGKHLGVLNWFPVHGTSMLGNNTLVTGDNKGVAAHIVEERMKSFASVEAADGFVAGFSQANVGDTSPNVLGAYCESGSGEELCSFEASLCNGTNTACHGRGPYYGLDDGGTRSCFEIGSRQARALLSSYSDKSTPTHIRGPVRSFHTYHNMSGFNFVLRNGTAASTCSAALGYSFAAGTSDGPGAFPFRQSPDQDSSPLWAVARNFLHKPSEEQERCHAPKKILLDVGDVHRPYSWTPNVVDIQMFRIGQLFTIVAPGEATTMSGRRWKAAVAEKVLEISAQGDAIEKPLVVLGGPANTYAHYIATEEEYDIQRYEGGSTLYGPHTLAAYMNLTTGLIPSLMGKGAKPPKLPAVEPPIQVNSSLSFISPVVFDSPGLFHAFGDVLKDVESSTVRIYRSGDVVSAKFVAANPRNDLLLEESYARVQYLNEASSSFEEHRDDADWDLVFRWQRTSSALGTSEASLSWEIPAETRPGLYRFVYTGSSRSVTGTISAFSGYSGSFAVG